VSILARGRRTSAIAAADDAELLSAVAALDVEAVEEAYERHATALCGLALLIAEDAGLAEDAVAGTFIALWRSPTSICLEEQSLRAALASELYTRCTQARGRRAPGQRTRICQDSQPSARADLTLLPCLQRDLLALIMLGEHSCREAAHRVGVNEAAAARMITDTLRTMGPSDWKPPPAVTGATARAQDVLASSMTLKSIDDRR
jgi:DNA-directed RNA polymerase specialized sigma24 family protein